MNVEETVVKEEEITEEDPLSDTNLQLKQDTLEVVGAPVKKERIDADEQISVKEELEDEDYDLEPKVDTVDDMISSKTDLQEFL